MTMNDEITRRTARICKQIREEYYSFAKPWIDALVRLELTAGFVVRKSPEGNLSVEKEYSPEVKDAREKILLMLEDLLKSICARMT